MNINDKKCAFTLAETLITLVIVGVVAALTIPNLIVKYQKEQTVTRLKKGYSIMSQAINRSIIDNGPISSWNFPEINKEASAKEFLKKYILPYLSIVDSKNEDGLKNINGGYTQNFSTNYKYFLNDGSAVSFNYNNYYYGEIYYDINGKKGPDRLGKDIFQMYIDNSSGIKFA